MIQLLGIRLREEIILLGFFSLMLATCNTIPAQGEPILREVNDFLIQLQEITLAALAAAEYDLLIIDYSENGSASGEWSQKQIQRLKKSKGGKQVLAYISIGEAERYRFYWQDGWAPGNPGWMGKENPNWTGNYKVKYWDSEWQKIVFSYLDRILDQGFDGIYMDIVDGYWYWASEAVESGEDEQLPSARDAADRMVDFILEIAQYCRDGRGKQSFILCPQNATGIITDASKDKTIAFLSVIDAVGVEDVFYHGSRDEDNPYNPQEDVISHLRRFTSNGKRVFNIEYLTPGNRRAVDRFYSLSKKNGYVPFAAERALDHIRINPGHEPD